MSNSEITEPNRTYLDDEQSVILYKDIWKLKDYHDNHVTYCLNNDYIEYELQSLGFWNHEIYLNEM